jgi:hypothetical protein
MTRRREAKPIYESRVRVINECVFSHTTEPNVAYIYATFVNVANNVLHWIHWVGKLLWQPSKAVLYLGKFGWLEERPSLHGVSWCCVRLATELTRYRSIFWRSAGSAQIYQIHQIYIQLFRVEFGSGTWSDIQDALINSGHPTIRLSPEERLYRTLSNEDTFGPWWLWGYLKKSIHQDLQKYKSSM